jgi:hypothetical protein
LFLRFILKALHDFAIVGGPSVLRIYKRNNDNMSQTKRILDNALTTQQEWTAYYHDLKRRNLEMEQTIEVLIKEIERLRGPSFGECY